MHRKFHLLRLGLLGKTQQGTEKKHAKDRETHAGVNSYQD